MKNLDEKPIRFTVHSVPPNKNRHMWSDCVQSILLYAMRKEAFAAKRAESIELYTRPIGIELTIYGTNDDREQVGDLDNLLAGVCDGLSRRPRNPNSKPSDWSDFENDENAGPNKSLLYEDDKII